MAKPTQTDELLEELLKQTKKQNEQNEKIIHLSEINEKRNSKRPIKSTKPTLFTTGKRASQSDYLSARSAIAQETFNKTVQKNRKDDVKNNKKAKAEEKKKADKIKKDEEVFREVQIENTEKIIETLEDGNNSVLSVKEKALKDQKRKDIKERKRREAFQKKEEEYKKSQRGFFGKWVDSGLESSREYIDGAVKSFEETTKIDTKFQTKEKKEEQRLETERHQERMDQIDVMFEKDLSVSDKRFKRLVKAVGGIENITPELIAHSERILDRISSDIYQRDSENGAKLLEIQLQQLQALKDSKELSKTDSNATRDAIETKNKQDKETAKAYEKTIDKIDEEIEVIKSSSSYSSETNVILLDLLEHEKHNNEKILNILRSTDEKFKEFKLSISSTIESTSASIIKTSEENTDRIVGANKDISDTVEDSNREIIEQNEEMASDARAERRDNFLTRAKDTLMRSKMVESLSALLKNSKASLKNAKNAVMNKIKPGAGGAGGADSGIIGTIATLFGAKYLGKFLGGPMMTKLLGKMGKVGGFISKIGGKLAGMTGKGMILGALTGDLTGGLLGGSMDSAGTKSAPKSPKPPKSPKKVGMFGKAFQVMKSFGSKALDLVPGGGLVKEAVSKSSGLIAKGTSKITSMIAKGGLKTVLKKIPLVGAAIGLGYGVSRMLDGDFKGAALEVASGIASIVPGWGTAASFALDGYSMKRDMDIEEEKSLKIPNTEQSPKPDIESLKIPKMEYSPGPDIKTFANMGYVVSKDKISSKSGEVHRKGESNKLTEICQDINSSSVDKRENKFGLERTQLKIYDELRKMNEEKKQEIKEKKIESETLKKNGSGQTLWGSIKSGVSSAYNSVKSFLGFGSSGSSGGTSVKKFPEHNGGQGQASMTRNASGGRVIKYPNGDTKSGGTRNWRNNNPGNLEAGSYSDSNGSIGSDGRFAIFPSMEAGFKAQSKLLLQGKNYKGLTLSAAITRYAPPGENNTAAYIQQVSSATGISPSAIMGKLSEADGMKLVKAMASHEGAKVGKLTKGKGSVSQTSQSEKFVAQPSGGPRSTPMGQGGPLSPSGSSTPSFSGTYGTNQSGGSSNSVNFARGMVGKAKYVWGGKGDGMALDCSGFVQKVMKKTGMAPDFPGSTETQLSYLKKGSRDGSVQQLGSTQELVGGDIIFFASHKAGRNVGHVAIMGSSSTMIHSSGGSKCKTGNERGCRGVIEVDSNSYFSKRPPNYMFRVSGSGQPGKESNQGQLTSQIGSSMSSGVQNSIMNGAGNSVASPGVAGQGGAGGAGGSSTSGTSGVGGSSTTANGDATTNTQGSTSQNIQNLIGGSVKSGIGGLISSTIGQKLGNMNSLPFGGVLQNILSGKQNMNNALINSNSSIGSGLSQISSAIPNMMGRGDSVPHIAKVDDSSLDILRGVLGGR